MTSDIARAILSHLGGHRFLFITGSQMLVSGRYGIMLHLPASQTRNRTNRVMITSCGHGIYDIDTGHFAPTTLQYRTCERRYGVQPEILRRTFAEMTGINIRA